MHRHDAPEPLRPGEVVAVEVELLPSATLFRRGEVLRLDLQGRWLYRDNPITGQFPANLRPAPRHFPIRFWLSLR